MNNAKKYCTPIMEVTKFDFDKSLMNDDIGDIVTVVVPSNPEIETNDDIFGALGE